MKLTMMKFKVETLKIMKMKYKVTIFKIMELKIMKFKLTKNSDEVDDA